MEIVLTNDNIEELKRIVNDRKFSSFLLDECSDVVVVATILQTLLDKVNELENFNNFLDNTKNL